MNKLSVIVRKDALGFVGIASYDGQFLCSCSGNTKARAEKAVREQARREINPPKQPSYLHG